MKYEQEYHKTAHNNLLTNPEYYFYRSIFANRDYFDGYLVGEDLLEYGVGLGQNIKVLRDEGYSVFGYDVSKYAVDFCKKQGIPATSKLPEHQFDMIFCRHVLEHTTYPYDELKTMLKLLKKDGRLVLILPRERHKKVGLNPDVNGHYWAWNFQCINNLLASVGFKVIHNSMLTERVGCHRLFFLRRFFPIYNLVTKLLGMITRCKELRIVAKKV